MLSGVHQTDYVSFQNGSYLVSPKISDSFILSKSSWIYSLFASINQAGWFIRRRISYSFRLITFMDIKEVKYRKFIRNLTLFSKPPEVARFFFEKCPTEKLLSRQLSWLYRYEEASRSRLARFSYRPREICDRFHIDVLKTIRKIIATGKVIYFPLFKGFECSYELNKIASELQTKFKESHSKQTLSRSIYYGLENADLLAPSFQNRAINSVDISQYGTFDSRLESYYQYCASQSTLAETIQSIKNADGENLLHLAVKHNNRKLAGAILQKSPMLFLKKDLKGVSPMDLAIKIRANLILESALKLFSKKNIPLSKKLVDSCVNRAHQHRNDFAIKLFLDETYAYLRSPQHYLISNRDWLLQYLRSKDFSSEVLLGIDRGSESNLLHLAVNSKDFELIEAVLNRCPSYINEVNSSRATPLLLAVTKDSSGASILRFFSKYSFGAVGPSKETLNQAFLTALVNENREAMAILVGMGADLSLVLQHKEFERNCFSDYLYPMAKQCCREMPIDENFDVRKIGSFLSGALVRTDGEILMQILKKGVPIETLRKILPSPALDDLLIDQIYKEYEVPLDVDNKELTDHERLNIAFAQAIQCNDILATGILVYKGVDLSTFSQDALAPTFEKLKREKGFLSDIRLFNDILRHDRGIATISAKAFFVQRGANLLLLNFEDRIAVVKYLEKAGSLLDLFKSAIREKKSELVYFYLFLDPDLSTLSQEEKEFLSTVMDKFFSNFTPSSRKNQINSVIERNNLGAVKYLLTLYPKEVIHVNATLSSDEKIHEYISGLVEAYFKTKRKLKEIYEKKTEMDKPSLASEKSKGPSEQNIPLNSRAKDDSNLFKNSISQECASKKMHQRSYSISTISGNAPTEFFNPNPKNIQVYSRNSSTSDGGLDLKPSKETRPRSSTINSELLTLADKREDDHSRFLPLGKQKRSKKRLKKVISSLAKKV